MNDVATWVHLMASAFCTSRFSSGKKVLKCYFALLLPPTQREWQPTTTGEPPPLPAVSPAWPWATPQMASGTWAIWRWWAESWTRWAWLSSTDPSLPTRSAPSPQLPTTSAMISLLASWRWPWSLSLPGTRPRGWDCSTSPCTRAKTCWRRRKETSLDASSESHWGQRKLMWESQG